jgi:hypothetical protein
MRRSTSAIALFCLVSATFADQPESKQLTPAERLAQIQKENKAAEAEYYKAAEALQDTPEGRKKYQELFQAYDKGQGERFMAAVELAHQNPKADIALIALEWVLTIPRSYYLPAGKLAMEQVAEHHAANPKAGKIVAWVGYYTPHEQINAKEWAAAMQLIRAVAEKNPDPVARGQAVMALAWQAKNKAAIAEHKKSEDAEKLAAEAERAFEAVLKDYADCPRLMREGQRSLGEEAKSELFELRHLRIGKSAPDIEGEDLDSVKFKLSDYRGKVVVLDFWGDW